jgi:hypothetical protein
MDFTQLRGLKSPDGARATDEAIHCFVDNLVLFFSQFKQKPTPDQFKIYLDYMNQITAKVNESEKDYYLKKYTAECPEHAEVMTLHVALKSFKDLPTRMQYWAASEEHGGTIRNSENHIIAVNKLDEWASSQAPLPKKSFFFEPKPPKDGDKENELKARNPSHPF